MTRFMFPALLALAPAACAPPGEVPEVVTKTPVAVTTEAVALRPIRGTFEAGGVVAARTTAAVASRIVAAVVSVSVAPGDRVRAGQRLIALDARDLEGHRQQAVASVAALERAAAASAADRDAADAALMLARTTHERIAALHARRSATSHELDEAVSALRAAEARLRAADARIAGSDATIEAARAAAAAAAASASFAVLTAPFDGVVTEKLIEPGNLASIGVPLLRIDDTRSFRLEARIDESRAAAVAVGDSVRVLLGTFGTSEANEIAGRVSEVSRAIDAASHAFLIKIDLTAHPLLRSGLFARARFGGDTREALTVPSSAIRSQGQLSTLFVVSQGRARSRVVRTAESAGDRVEIVSGVVAGEEVIVARPPDLRDGDPVRIGSGTPSPTAGAR
jgi:RND family efflux transporter MFP subunit